MKILGIHDGHNASAALMIDGRVAAAVSEERMAYDKNEMGFPLMAVQECLDIAGCKAEELDEVAFSTTSFMLFSLRTKREKAFSIQDSIDEQHEYWKPLLYENHLNTEYLERIVARHSKEQPYDFTGMPAIGDPEEERAALDAMRKKCLKDHFGIAEDKVAVLDHHDCHKSYAYWGSPFREDGVLVVSADGGGDATNATVSIIENGSLKELARSNTVDMARIYKYMTLILGMKMCEHEYKIMGLAPYATPYEIQKTDKAFKDLFTMDGMLPTYRNRPKDMYFHFKKQLEASRFDGIAGGLQQMVEDIGIKWFETMVRKTGATKVVFSGGLSMNVKLNKKITELEGIENMYVAASGGDESLAVGACYELYCKDGREAESFRNNYMGSSLDQVEIDDATKALSDVIVLDTVDNQLVAELLAKGLVIGIARNGMEFGARALGNRSIVADPRNPLTVKRINDQIKRRDFWMPFAPSILSERANDYIINPKGILSDHMTMSFDTTPQGRTDLVAAMHAGDFTVRAHIVDKAINPAYHDLISKFEAFTGVGALLNTSFNLHGKPVVRNPEQAVDVFSSSKLDGMLLNDTLVLRKHHQKLIVSA